jgi:predicted nucleic acid-binding protein
MSTLRAGPLRPRSAAAEIRGRSLHDLGYGLFDALHLACAKEAAVDALLTTDDRFLRKALRGIGNPAVRVVIR